MASQVINVQNLSKRFRVYDKPIDRLKEWLTPKGVSYHWAYWALRDISFQVVRGASLGIIGANGAGKSTLLKILCGTLSPTTGSVHIEGRITGLLELGSGFHPEFTGRQNIYLNARLLGLSDTEIEEKLPAIVDFAELGEFIDHPLRIYSTGMALRLGFSVAANIDPDILIIDEALAVGDAYFQQKCIKHLRAFRERGGTLLFVSHDPAAVKLLCEDALLLYEGRILAEGKPDDVLDYYNTIIARNVSDHTLMRIEKESRKARSGPKRTGTFDAILRDIEITNKGKQTRSINAGEKMRMTISLVALSDIPSPTIGIIIRDRLGYDVFGTNTHRLDKKIPALHAGQEIRVHFDVTADLGVGDYTITAAAHTGTDHLDECFDWADKFIAFKILPSKNNYCDGAVRLPVEIETELHDTDEDDAQHVLEKIFSDAPSRIHVNDASCAWLFSGWHPEEEVNGWHYRWTTQRASFIMRTGKKGKLSLCVHGDDLICESKGVTLALSGNGIEIGTYTLDTTEITTAEFTIPPHLQNTVVKFILEVDTAFVPADVRDTTDTRMLGVMVEEICAT